MVGQKIVAIYRGMPHYQAYYWTGLSEVASLSISNAPWWYRLGFRPDLSVDIESYLENIKRGAGLQPKWNAAEVEKFVTEYIWDDGTNVVRFAIDAHDGKEIFSPALQKTCDLYFKANKWKSDYYADNVHPLVNGNGFLRRRHLEKLTKLRGYSKNNDFLFISRIWGGVEHNIRLFEALVSLKCKKKLVAIFVKGAGGEKETADAIRRLESVGVTCTFDLMPIRDLWLEIAQSRLVMLRAGKYMCIPWRMIDLLCMGACIVTDADFEPEWPEPLEDGFHYRSAKINRPANTEPAPVSEYGKVVHVVDEMLIDLKITQEMEHACTAYFDRFAAPAAVGDYVISTVKDMQGQL